MHPTFNRANQGEKKKITDIEYDEINIINIINDNTICIIAF